MVEQIEDIDAELHFEPLGEFRVFYQAKVKVLIVWSNKSIAAHVTKVLVAGTISGTVHSTWRLKCT